mgnify:CR=1 FL=1
MFSFSNIIHILAILVTGLMAGLFYSYSCSVNPGLGRLTDANYLAAMQNINRAILNPAFFACFLGTLVLLPLSAYFHYSQPVGLKFWLVAGAAMVYIVGLFGVTMAGNVPLNNMLDKTDLTSATAEQLAQLRAAFEGPWNRWHAIRTIAVVLSFLMAIAASIVPEK